MENQIQQFKKENNDNQQANYKKLHSLLKQISEGSEGQEISQDEMRRGFIGLAQQNQELVKLNKELKQQLEIIEQELNQTKQERIEKKLRKQTRANRTRLPKRDPMTAEIYKKLIKESEGPTYLNVRLRLALCLLAVSGMRINELLNIRVFQLKTLIQESWITIDGSKRGPSNHKRFLTKEGKKIIHDRKKDFQFILLLKEPNNYVFTSKNQPYKKLRREGITKGVNKVMRSVSQQLSEQPNVTSHSFRIGYINQLSKDSKNVSTDYEIPPEGP